MDYFEQVVGILDGRFPGEFQCRRGSRGRAWGLEIRSVGRPGFAFVYDSASLYHPNPLRQDPHLLAVWESDEAKSESWNTFTPDECVERLLPWAFPRDWTRPEPVDPAKETRRLSALATALAASVRTRVHVAEPDPALAQRLTPEGRRVLDRDLAALRPARLARHFPWDPRGQLALKAAVLLNVYPTETPLGTGRFACLAALGPSLRKDEQALRVELTALFPAHQSHRWHDRPWLWQRAEAPASERLGFDLGDGSAEHATAAESLRLLDDGRIEEALGLYGVALSDDLHRILGGQRIVPPACCAHPDASWTALLIATLRASAPWLLPGAVPAEAERIRRLLGRKPGKRSRSWKLAIFPGQSHLRKASLVLAADRDGRNPRLVIEATATHTRLADTSWKRPIEVDFRRHGVPYPDDPEGPGGLAPEEGEVGGATGPLRA